MSVKKWISDAVLQAQVDRSRAEIPHLRFGFRDKSCDTSGTPSQTPSQNENKNARKEKTREKEKKRAKRKN
jgi:hypothetical protein